MVENSENLERATISEAYLILESFNLTNEETCRIAQQWQIGRLIPAIHEVIYDPHSLYLGKRTHLRKRERKLINPFWCHKVYKV